MKVAVVPVTAYQQNCSLILCEETGAVAAVDPGGDIEQLEAQIAAMGGKLAVVLLTHGHMDHCAQARVLADRHGVQVIGPHEEDRFWIEQLPAVCKAVGFPPAEAFEPDRWLHDGDTVNVGNIVLQVLHTPGHTPGHVIFFHSGEKLAFVGDVLFQGSIGRTDFPRGDFDTLIHSIREKLFPLGDEVAFVPGHGPLSTFGEERQTNPFVSGVYR
jgi:glyoxylase-like metal-dependent hydrolase (beta-lactamase superfamily II)